MKLFTHYNFRNENRKWNCKILWFHENLADYLSSCTCISMSVVWKSFWKSEIFELHGKTKKPSKLCPYLVWFQVYISVYSENGLHVLWFVILLCSMYQHIRQSKWSQSRQWVYRQRTSAEWCQRSTRSGASRIWWTTSWRPWKSQYTSLPTKPLQ